MLRRSGFEVQYSSYCNMFLFLPAAVMRLFGFTGQSSLDTSSPFDRLFYGLVYIESILVRYMSLPFGTGIAIIARKK